MPSAAVRDEKNSPYLLFMLLLSLYAVVALALGTFARLTPQTRSILWYADTAVCLVFFIDFCVTFARAPNRARYFFTWGWLDLVSSIPAVDALRWGRAARILRILRILRGIRATKILSEFILYRRAESGFLAALLVSVLLVVLSAAAILQFETSPQANIKTGEDAIWWAFVTVTTVGYGDRFPVSSEGRLIAALLMTAGVGLFGTFSGFVASWFLKPSEREQKETGADVDSILREVRELREEVRALRSERS